MLQLRALPALRDNYIWTLSAPDGRALLVDPGQAQPVFDAAARGLTPVAVLLTHHHPDHVGGAAEILERWNVPCHFPADARIAVAGEAVSEGARVRVPELDAEFTVIGVPGHTLSHVAFVGEGLLFCGDTLFSLGCGRLFEGTPEQMLESLDRLAGLPGRTRVCCGHEYTLDNARFARVVDPDNPVLQRREAQARALREAGQPTLPSRLEEERAANPFLRCGEPALVTAAARFLGHPPVDRVDSFAALRRWKDGFRAA